MPTQSATVSVKAWESDGILLERYAYTAGDVIPLSKHTHNEYQFGMSLDCQGEYHYRGAVHVIPKGNLSIIHSGEMHAPSDRTFLPKAAHFLMAHLDPQWLHTVGTEIVEKPTSDPFFPAIGIADLRLQRLFLDLQSVVDHRASQLEQDTALWAFLSYLITHHASNRSAVPPVKPVHIAIQRVLDYLHADYANDISLKDLAAIADLSRFHFCRVFSQTVGLSPSVYQTQLRIAQAKKLLTQGLPIATVATMVGFYDQSHFGWHFKRLVGATPGNYVGQTAIFSYPFDRSES